MIKTHGKTHGRGEEDETSFQYGTNVYQASSSKFTHSANPDEECRFILLGGDVDANKDVCRIIFRNQQNQQRTELDDWELQENRVHGRHVTVAVSPPTWLEHLRSYIFLSRGIKSIKKDIKKCVSMAFPGPNAFLLVIRDGRDNRKEHYLLKAVASVFGKEVLDYSMVLLIKGSGQKCSDPVSMKCVKRCGQRHHVLEDTDSSVQELFSKVLRMIDDKKRKFFIPPEYEEFMETEFELWEKRRILKMNEFLAKCQDEKDNLIGELRKSESELQKKLDVSKKSERELQKKLDVSKKSESDLQKELGASKSSNYELRKNCEVLQIRESELQKELDASKKSGSELQKELDASKKSGSELQKELDASKVREDQLRMELNTSQQRENKLRKQMKDYETECSKLRKYWDLDPSKSELQKELDVSKKSESELQKELNTSEKSERKLQKELDASKKSESELQKMLDASKKSESELQKELDASKKSESELQKMLDASKKSVSELQKKLDASKKSESELQKELDASKKRERELKKDLDASKKSDRKLQKELDVSIKSESELQKELDVSIKSENELQKKLDASKKSVSELKKKLDASKKREHELQKELEASNKSESELQKELEATQLRETKLMKELDDFRRNECNPGRLLDYAQQRESEDSKEDNNELEPQASGTRNRRGSKDLDVPNCPLDQNISKPEHSESELQKKLDASKKSESELQKKLDASKKSESELQKWLDASKKSESELNKDLDASKKSESELKKDLDASRMSESELQKELDASKKSESELKKDLDASKKSESELQKELDASKKSESELKKDLDASKKSESELQKELDASKKSESELNKDLDASKKSESELKKDLDASRMSESELQKELDASKKSESELQKKLDASKKSESELNKDLDASRKSESELQNELDASKKSESELKKDLDASKKREHELQKELEATQLRETKLIKELDDFRRNECNPGRLLDSAQQRESEVNKEDCGVKKDNTVQEPQASGTRNRRGSKDLEVPNSGAGNLDRLPGIMDSQKYQVILKKNVMPSVDKLNLGQDEEDETFFQNGANFYVTSTSKFTHSANPDEECRFILLGGDVDANKEVCRIIFRNQQNQQRTDLDDWELQENRVQGRHVTVAISPTTWLEHLRSFLFQFWAIRSIKKDIKKCLSVTFPGPNAFLLVINDGRDNGKEHYLLEAVDSVFGKKALDYSMVLLIKGSGQKRSDHLSMECVKRCGQRHHVLEDTDSSVQELFSKVLSMVVGKKSKFCIPPKYEKFMETDFESWEKRRISKMNEFLAECQDEKDNLIGELDASNKRESELQKKLEASKKRERELQKELEATQLRETKLIKELDDFRRNQYNPGRLLDSAQQRKSEDSKEDCGVKKDNTVQEPQASGTRKRRGSKDIEVPNYLYNTQHLLTFLETLYRALIPDDEMGPFRDDLHYQKAPLSAIAHGQGLQAHSKVTWTETAKAAFERLKQTLQMTPTLGIPDPMRLLTQTVDEKGGCMTSVLLQEHGGKLRPVAYFSAKLDPVAAGLLIQLKDNLTKPHADALHDLKPGEWIMVKDFRRKNWKAKRCLGPFQILLNTLTAVKIVERATWNHASHCKRFNLSDKQQISSTETMARRRKMRGQTEGTELEKLLGQDEEDETSFQYGTNFYVTSTSKFTHSANPDEECRFILLGGDVDANKEVCRIIFRNQWSRQRTELDDWELQENRVHGRHVTVAVSPPTWLKHLRSSLSLSTGISCIKNDIEKCVSMAFPGPNAFLLVIRDGRDNGKEHFLLKAVASVFGKEALDYSMVLLIKGSGKKHSDLLSMKCVKRCGQRHHVLEDTDSSVQELFSKVLRMIVGKKRKFFIPPEYEEFMETDFESWEKRRISNMNEFLAKCQDEKDNLIGELDASKKCESELQKKLDASKKSEREQEKELEASQLRETKLIKELDDFRRNECNPGRLHCTRQQASGTRNRRGSNDLEVPNCTLQNDDDTNEPKTDLRLVLLGGDDNNYVAEIILRTDKKKEMINPKKGTMREGSVDGRQLSVFVSPSYWMKHLDSFWFFQNGVESIRAELQNCTSMTFPGPHAFLLVMRAGQTPGKEHLLLKAITNVFGAEALEYTMVLFVYGHKWENPKDALKNCCVKMCGTKYFILENEENVEELFRRVEAMTQRKQSRFFIQRSYENLMKVYFEPWEKAQAYKEMQLKRELDELRCSEEQLREELEASRHQERVIREELKTARYSEEQLREELEASRHQESVLQEDLKTARCSEEQLREELEASKCQESVLQEELKTARCSEEHLREELEASRHQESVLQEELKTARCSEEHLREELEASRHQESVLQEELKTARCSEEQLREELEASRHQESVLREELKTARCSEAGQWTPLRRSRSRRRRSKEGLNPNMTMDDL
ncbi:uncharacterized protein LOC132860360 [Tachysurus vachellii]|uniref:uncharacterized protein LOC132860360 n=1 Tax=Tachysurus vachellii TaxID=175792 RepID=UPI00296AA1C7|nr:uncharacterized protein LOC132860360 [Tachysurus vachellii]